MTVGHWIRPPFLDENGKWKDTATQDNPEGDWPWCGDQFLAAVHAIDGRNGREYWEYAVLHFTEDGLESEAGTCGWSPEEISWICRIQEPETKG